MGQIRFFLALAVVINHIGPIFGLQMIPGSLAVEAFFIISGFYMSLVLGSRYPLTFAGIKKFFTNRYLRLAPAYWVVIILSMLQAYIVGSIYTGISVNDVVTILQRLPLLHSVWLVFTNVFLIGIDLTMFQKIIAPGELAWTADYNAGLLPAHKLLLITPAWSLGTELWFYLIAPFFAGKSFRWLVGFLAASLAIRFGLYWNGLYEDPWSYRFFPSELAFFLVGMLLHRFYREYGRSLSFNAGRFAIASVVILIFVSPLVPLEETVKQVIFLVLFSALIPAAFHVSKNNLIDRRIGELSFPIYISHTLVQQTVLYVGRTSEMVGRISIVVVTIVLALAVRRWIEDPVDKLR